LIFKQLNIVEKDEYFKDQDTDENILCECCQEPITKENLGNIVPGSRKFYCKEPSCFATYIQTTID
jgi:hypothetical protein